MGREWLYKATGAGDGGKTTKQTYKDSSSSGCMSAFYNLFDVQHHQYFRVRHPSLMSLESDLNDNQDYNFCPQGIEAPRNSLESPESSMKVDKSSSKVKELMKLDIPIKTTRSKFTNELSTNYCISPGTKTPNLVARLMGLDLLPEYSSPRASASSVTANSHHYSHSFPETPRLSTASTHSMDNNDYHHRLSLQIDKENKPSHKKTKSKTMEKNSRRLDSDITNTMSPTRGKCHRRDSNLVLLKTKKALVTETTGKAKRDEPKPLSSSPRMPLLDINSNVNKRIINSRKLHQTSAMKKPKNLVRDETIKRITSERYDLRLKNIGQHDKVFVSKKSSALVLPIPKHVLKVKKNKKVQFFKKEITSASSTTRFSQNQVFLPSHLNSSYNSNNTHNFKATVSTTSCSFSDCEVFERSMRRLLSTAYVAEVEEIVVEIEREILWNLVDDIVTET